MWFEDDITVYKAGERWGEKHLKVHGTKKSVVRGDKHSNHYSRNAQKGHTTPKLPIKDWAFQIIFE